MTGGDADWAEERKAGGGGVRRVQPLEVEGYGPLPGHLKPEWRSIEPLPLCRERIHPAPGTFAHRKRPGSHPSLAARGRARFPACSSSRRRRGERGRAPDPGSPRDEGGGGATRLSLGEAGGPKRSRGRTSGRAVRPCVSKHSSVQMWRRYLYLISGDICILLSLMSRRHRDKESEQANNTNHVRMSDQALPEAIFNTVFEP